MPPDLPPDPLALAIRFLRQIADREYAEPADNQELDAGHWARAHAIFALHQLDAIQPGITGEPPRRQALKLFGLTSAEKAELQRQNKSERDKAMILRRKGKRPAE